MTDEPMERDAALGTAMRGATGDPTEAVDWADLRRTVNLRAASALRRRRRQRRLRVALPAGIAACLALLLVSQTWERTPVDPSSAGAAAGVQAASIDELLDADVSDRQLRALLSGAAEADELLLIAAAEHQR